jgi:hypothetical protein
MLQCLKKRFDMSDEFDKYWSPGDALLAFLKRYNLTEQERAQIYDYVVTGLTPEEIAAQELG